MNTTELIEPSTNHSRGNLSNSVVFPQTCSTCSEPGAADANGSDASPSYVYALGHIEARFPRLSLEKEFAQAAGRAPGTGQTDREMFQTVLANRKNRYLLRQLCWVLSIQGLETYLLQPRDPADCELLLEALRAIPNPMNIDAVIGLRGPIAPPEMCNGLALPVLYFDQIYSFDRDALMSALPRPDKTPAKVFEASANELFERVMQLTDNAGAADDHRALNYLAMRYSAIYTTVADAHARNASLTAVEVLPSRLSGPRSIVDVIFSFTNRNNEFTEKFFVRVDVTEEFPFLVSRIAPYYDR